MHILGKSYAYLKQVTINALQSQLFLFKKNAAQNTVKLFPRLRYMQSKSYFARPYPIKTQ